MTVSLVRFDDNSDSLRKAIELCSGFENLKSNDRVLIKPNYGFRHRMVPPYGTVTTSKILDGIIQLLLEHGCKDISIGEGAIIGMLDELDPYAKRGFKGTGVDKLAKRYGVRLIDFNKAPFQQVDLGGLGVHISREVLETDFLINVPVLKTHSQTKVSLGFKNLKGCLSQASKKRFHTTKRLDNLICLLNESIESDLVIIDGIYMLEKGPDTLLGAAHRKDLIIASRDRFACDVIGATILGIDPSQVDHLREFAERHNRSFDISMVELEGEDIEALKENLEWGSQLDEELFAPQRLTGFSVPNPGKTLCSGCYATVTSALLVFSKDNPKVDFSSAELCFGLESIAETDTEKTFLYGNCAIRNNASLQNATRVEGCPPSLITTVRAYMKVFLSRPMMIRTMLPRAAKLIGMKLGIYEERFQIWERYRSKEFDRTHF